MNLTKHWAATLDDYVIDLAWSPDGTCLAGASAGGPITLWDHADGQVRHELPGHENGTNCLAFAPGATFLLASGGQDGAVRWWDAGAGRPVASTRLGPGWVEHLAWRPAGNNRGPLLGAARGRSLAFLGADGTVRQVAADAQKTISALAWQPAGGCVAAAAFGGVRLWDGDDFLVQKELSYGNAIHALTWSPDSKWLVSGNQDPSVHLWIPAEDSELHMSGYAGKVKHVQFDSSSRWLATSGGTDACVWDCAGAGPEGRDPVMLPHDSAVVALAFQHAHGLLATAAQDGTVHLWSVDRRQPLRATIKMPRAPTRLAWSPDDRLLAIGSEAGTLYVLRCS